MISIRIEREKQAIKIRSVQAASVYRVEKGYKYVDKAGAKREAFIDWGDAVISDSLFTRYARKHGVTVNKQNFSFDFSVMKFEYSVDADISEEDIKPAISYAELREYFYEHGATITWKIYDKNKGEVISEKTMRYRMLMRSPGKAKQGHCIFVREDLQEHFRDYITMDLWQKMPYENAKIVELSAYAPMISATAIDYIKIPLENMFVLQDEKVSMTQTACIVESKDETYRKQCTVREEPSCNQIVNVLWDGMGIADESIFPENMDGFIYCRSHFFKSCLFRGSIQNYFKDYYGDEYESATVTDMFGRVLRVSDIKVIVTENSLKWMKFIDIMSEDGSSEGAWKYYEKKMQDEKCMFQIVKTAHPSKYGNLQRSSFQMNNTLLTTDKEILQKVAATSVEYINKMKHDDEAFLDYLKITGSQRYSINNVLIDLYRRNSDFRRTEYFKKKKREKLSELKNKRFKMGKLFQEGDNLTICGNVIAMLKKVTGQEYLDEGCFKVKDDAIQCYTERFPEGTYLAGFRSPHNSPNNIIHLQNVYPDELHRYFPKLGKNVIVINGIQTDVQCRLNGQDLDSDACFVTNQPQIVNLAKKAYKECPTIVNGILPSGSAQYNKSMTSYAAMDNSIASAQAAVGESSNLAQLALSYWFDDERRDNELKDVFIICSVLAQLAIDSGKRTFNLNINSEINRLRNLPCMKKGRELKYPKFYTDVQNYKYRRRPELQIRNDEEDYFFQCPMDIIYQLIEEGVDDMRKKPQEKTGTIHGWEDILPQDIGHDKVNRKQCKRVIEAVNRYDKKVGGLDSSCEGYADDKLRLFEECIYSLRNLTIKTETMHKLILSAIEPEDASVMDKMFVVLYNKDKQKFLGVFNEKCEKFTNVEGKVQ